MTDAAPMDAAALRRFLERVASVLGHDLRTPLGTVVNYLSLLSEDPVPPAAQLQEIAGRVRAHAAEVVALSQLLADAIVLMAEPRRSERHDPAALLRSIADEVDAALAARCGAAKAGTAAVTVEIDPALVGFVWRAFLRLDASVRSRAPLDVELRCAREGGVATVAIGLDGALDSGLPVVAIDRFVRSAAAKVSGSRRLALELGTEMVGVVDGSLELFGTPGAVAGLRLRVPQST